MAATDNEIPDMNTKGPISFYKVFVHPVIRYAAQAQSKGTSIISARVLEQYFQKAIPAFFTRNGPQAAIRELADIASKPELFSTKLQEEMLASRENLDPRLKSKLLRYFNLFPKTMRDALRRPKDPSGELFPPSLENITTEDLMCMFPKEPPQFQPGERPVSGTSLELIELLGQGPFGETWKAKHTDRPHLPPVALEFFNSGKSAEAFRNSIATLDNIAHSLAPASVTLAVKNVFLNNDPPCREEEYIEGEPLDDFFWKLLAKNRWSPKNATNLILTIAKVLNRAHQCKVVHGDLKPSDVLVADSAKVRIKDFGLATTMRQAGIKFSDRHLKVTDQSVSVALSPYSSPQVLLGEKPEVRDDLYSLGVIWFQLCAGDLTAHPGQATGWREMLASRGIDSETIQVITDCVQESREARPSSIQAILERFPEKKVEPASAKPAGDKATAEQEEEAKPATDIFISYRRKPSKNFALRIHDCLRRMGYKVFIDKEGLRSGDWWKTLQKNVVECTDFILILDEDIFSNYGKTEDDWVVREIFEARQNNVEKIIPIMDSLDFNSIPLPKEMEWLKKNNAFRIETDNDLVFKASIKTKLIPNLKSKNTTTVTRVLGALSKLTGFAYKSVKSAQIPKKVTASISSLVGTGTKAETITLPAPQQAITDKPPVLLSQWKQKAKKYGGITAAVLLAYYLLFHTSILSCIPNPISFLFSSSRFPDVQKYAVTPLRAYKGEWQQVFRDSNSNFGAFRSINGTSDQNILVATQYAILKLEGEDKAKKLSTVHKENRSQCDSLMGPYFNSRGEGVAFSYESSLSNFLQMGPSGISRIPVKEKLLRSPEFFKFSDASFGCVAGDDVYMLKGGSVVKSSANPKSPASERELQVMPPYEAETTKTLEKLEQLKSFTHLWTYYPGYYAGSVHVNGNEVRVVDQAGKIESLRFEGDSNSDGAFKVFGDSLSNFCLVTNRGAAYRRNKGKMDLVVKANTGDRLVDLWVSPAGRAYALKDYEIMVLE